MLTLALDSCITYTSEATPNTKETLHYSSSGTARSLIGDPD